MELLPVNHNIVTDEPSSSANSELNQRMGAFGRLEDNFRESEL